MKNFKSKIYAILVLAFVMLLALKWTEFALKILIMLCVEIPLIPIAAVIFILQGIFGGRSTDKKSS